jgi:hypothetical protein
LVLKNEKEFDRIKTNKRLCVTGETRITVREHIVSQPFAWAEVREVTLASFCYLAGGDGQYYFFVVRFPCFKSIKLIKKEG